MKTSLYLILLTFINSPIFASHLKGGNIQVTQVNEQELIYEITVTIYTDLRTGIRAYMEQKDVPVCFGDGSSGIASRVNGNGNGEEIDNNIGKSIYKIQHKYASNLTAYRVYVALISRNQNIRNIKNSDYVPFYIETLFNSKAINSTPSLNNDIGILYAKVKQVFIYNPKATDAEGDSLAYRLTMARTSNSIDCTTLGIPIENFKQPNEVNEVGTFKINELTGDLTWNAPTQVGTYVCSFIVEEWRKGVKISLTVRDMEIVVKDEAGQIATIPPYEAVTKAPYANEVSNQALVLSTENEVISEMEFTIFPNPNSGVFKAEIVDKIPSKVVFQLFDNSGKLLQEFKQMNLALKHFQEFNVEAFSEQILILKVNNGTHSMTKKVIIK